jgi:GDP-L-fucose synthase
MESTSKIYVAGHRGLVGSAIMRRLIAAGYHNIVTRSHAELDLTRQEQVLSFFRNERPEYVFVTAAKVGGIVANNTYPAEFIYQNLMIETNLIHSSYESRVRKLLFLGSSCIYPKHAPQPMREEYLLAGALEPTNESYAVAKIAGIKLCSAYNRQYGTNFLSVMPTNLYGPGDSYDLQNSHVLPALIRKMHEAKKAGSAEVVVWGTGRPRREFLYSDDLADACVFLMERCDASQIGEFVNIGVGHDLSIREVAELVADVVGYRGALMFDVSKPDGTPQKLLEVNRMKALGWVAKTPLRLGLEKAYRDFLQRTYGEVAELRPDQVGN